VPEIAPLQIIVRHRLAHRERNVVFADYPGESGSAGMKCGIPFFRLLGAPRHQ